MGLNQKSNLNLKQNIHNVNGFPPCVTHNFCHESYVLVDNNSNDDDDDDNDD